MSSLDRNLVVIGGSAGYSGVVAATAYYVNTLRAIPRAERQSPRLPVGHSL
jgi:hypothetical protein